MKNKTLKGMLALVVLSLSVGVSPVMADSTVVRFNPSPANVAIGQVVTVNVQIDSVTGLAGAEVNISYNPALLEVQDADPNKAGVQIAPGSFLKPDFVAQNAADNAQGKISFAVTQVAPTQPVNGSGVLATISFKGKADGTSALTFNVVNLSTSGGTAIGRAVQNGQVKVGSGGPTPTPTPTGAPGPTPTPGPTPSGGILGYHTVRYGQTLMCIGRAYAVSPWAIASQNGLVYPYRLYVGRRLSIPYVPWKVRYGPVCARQFGGVTPPPPPGGYCRVRYVVRPGDTLYAIAWRFRTSVWIIVADNNLPNANLIFAGQVLCIR